MTSPTPSDMPFTAPRESVATPAGDVRLPIHYRDGFAGTALFAVDLERAASVLQETVLPSAASSPANEDASSRLAPVEHQGQATVAITFYDYRDTSLGPYREVALALLVTPSMDLPSSEPASSDLATGEQPTGVRTATDSPPPHPIGYYLLDLPVTTDLADVVGRHLWGYPKFVAGVSLQTAADNFSGQLSDAEGETILRLAGQPGPHIKTQPSKDVTTYSWTGSSTGEQEDARTNLLRTTITTDCPYNLFEPGSLTLQVAASGHLMTARLRRLGLEDQTPIRWQTTDAFRAELPAGIVAGGSRSITRR